MTEGAMGMTAAGRGGRLRSLSRLGGLGVAAVVTAVSLLLLVPASGRMPAVSLDLAWEYVVAAAAARHVPFGRDVVFTFGPLSPLYTGFFLPDQRLEMSLLKAVAVAAFCLGAVGASRGPMRWCALALPLFLANLILPDAFFLAAPLPLVLLATVVRPERRREAAALAALAAVLGPLLLVKGTMAVPVAACVALAAAALWRRGRLAALALPCAAAASLVLCWLALGQHLADLPTYFRRQALVAAGYTDAMSATGDLGAVWTYLGCALGLLATLAVPRRAPTSVTLAAAVILFVAFKAGFVRHDAHPLISASTLALLSLLLFLHRGTLAAAAGLLVGVAGWVAIVGAYLPVTPGADLARLFDAVGQASRDLAAEVADPGRFRRDFAAADAAIARAADLPPTVGPVDLYPDDGELLLASRRDYDPRPVFQSYSAYTPELARLNAAHLAGPRAPRTVFFEVSPIDGRFPSLEDGASWPALLGLYRFRGFAQSYAVLDRDEGAAPAPVGPALSSGTFAFGRDIAVPDGAPFVWATMKFRPTALGRLASALFKLPPLRVRAILATGGTAEFRLVPGMVGAGFLLSPLVSDVRDFVALRSTDPDALAGQRVTAIRVTQDGDSGLWGSELTASFSALDVPPDPAVDGVALGGLPQGPPAAGLPQGGACMVDTVDGAPAGPGPIAVKGRIATVTGWGLASPAEGRVGSGLSLALIRYDGTTLYAPAERLPRPDVDAAFHLPASTQAGFSARFDLRDLGPSTTLRIVQDGPGGPEACGAPLTLAR